MKPELCGGVKNNTYIPLDSFFFFFLFKGSNKSANQSKRFVVSDMIGQDGCLTWGWAQALRDSCSDLNSDDEDHDWRRQVRKWQRRIWGTETNSSKQKAEITFSISHCRKCDILFSGRLPIRVRDIIRIKLVERATTVRCSVSLGGRFSSHSGFCGSFIFLNELGIFCW